MITYMNLTYSTKFNKRGHGKSSFQMSLTCLDQVIVITHNIISFWTLDKIDVGQGATNGSSLTTLGLGYLG